jgi:hypothetical protein
MSDAKSTPFVGRYRRAGSYRRRPYSYRRRRYGYRRRSFPMRRYTSGFPVARPHGALVMREQTHREREFQRMRTQQRYTLTAGSATGTSGLNVIEYFKINDIYTPGALGTSGAATIPAVNGFARQNGLYTNWQVRGCRAHVRVTMDMSGSSRIPVEFMLVPLQTAQIASVTSSTPWEQMRKHIGRSRVATVAVSSDSGYNFGDTQPVSSFTSPSKVESYPQYYSRVASYGVATTVPVDTPVFVLLFNWLDTLPATPTFHIEVTLDYSVMWWGRFLPTLSAEESLSTLPYDPRVRREDEDEDSFDKIPLFIDPLVVSEPEIKKPPPPPTPAQPRGVPVRVPSKK